MKNLTLSTLFLLTCIKGLAQNVGIGANTPLAKLHISGTEGNQLRVTSTAGWASLDIEASSGETAIRLKKDQAYTWNIRNRQADNSLEILEKNVLGNQRLVIMSETGNVGIGVSSPTSRLQVNGSIAANGIRIGNGSQISGIRYGSHVAGGSASGQLTTTLTFPQAFSSVPHLVVSIRHDPNWNVSDAFAVTVKSITTTQAIFIIRRLDSNVAWSQNLVVDYIAIQ